MIRVKRVIVRVLCFLKQIVLLMDNKLLINPCYFIIPNKKKLVTVLSHYITAL